MFRPQHIQCPTCRTRHSTCIDLNRRSYFPMAIFHKSRIDLATSRNDRRTPLLQSAEGEGGEPFGITHTSSLPPNHQG